MKKISLLFIGYLILALACTAQSPRKAIRKMNLYNYSRAIELLLKSVDKPKFHLEAVPLLAECYRHQNNITQSLYWYEKAVALQPSNTNWSFEYSRLLESSGNYTQALDNWKKIAAVKPEDQRIQQKLKQCEIILSDWQYRLPQFEVRKLEKINSEASDFSPCFYANGFTFTTDRGKDYTENESYGWTGRPYLKMMFTKPLEPGDFFGELRPPVLMERIFNHTYHDGPVAFSGDTIAYFTRTLDEKQAKKDHQIRTNRLKIFTTTRVNGDWQKPEASPLNSYEYSVGHPALSYDGSTLYFASDMPGGQGGVDIWKCRRENGNWSKPVNLGPGINTAGNEMFPTIKSDGTLFFASDGLPGYGGLDIFGVERSGESFGEPYNVMAPVNSSYDDFSMAWFPGTNYGMFSSDRPGGKGLDDIYAFKKVPCKVEEKKILLPAVVWGLVKDKSTGLPISGATVFVLNETSDSVYILKTDAEGKYSMELPGISQLIVKAVQSRYIPDCFNWPKETIIQGIDNQAPRDLLLSKLEVNKIFRLDNIYYDFDKYNIRPDAEPALDKLVNIMKENPIAIELGSHTDCRGSFEYNDKLSLRRAESAVAYLLENGIESGRISSKGYGEYQLLNSCSDGIKCTETEHQQNRRTEFKVVSLASLPADEPEQFNPEQFRAGSIHYREALPKDFFMQCR